MIQFETDLVVLFSGVANNRYQVYGVSPEGDVIAVFDPHTQGNDLWPAKPFEVSRSIGTGSEFTTVGDDFYLTYGAFWVTPGSGQSLADYDTIVVRLTVEGTLEAIAELPSNWAPYSQGIGPYSKTNDSADHQGSYFFGATNPGGRNQIFRITPEGAVDQVTGMPDPPGHVATGLINGMTSVGSELVFFGDRRFPRGLDELWRLDERGVVDLLYESNTRGVIDLEEFAGSAWFTARDMNGDDPTALFRYTPGEGVEQITLPRFQTDSMADFKYLHVSDDRMLMFGRGFIGEVAADGSVTTLLNEFFTFPDSVGILNDRVYFTGPDGLYRVSDVGVVSRIQGFDGGASPEAWGLTLSGDHLYFTGTASTTGDFGEPIRFVALYSMDADETITRLTGVDTSAPEIYDMGNVFGYTLTLPEIGAPPPEPVTPPPPPPEPSPPEPAPPPASGEPGDAAVIAIAVILDTGQSAAGITVNLVDQSGLALTTALTDASGLVQFALEPGTLGQLTVSRAYAAQTDPAITATDALEILRMAVGLEPSWGAAAPRHYIAADVNRDGAVDATDALEVLRHAVGLPSDFEPEWVFIDTEADLSAIRAQSVSYTETIDITSAEADLAYGFRGILLGNLDMN
ncbi:MAG: dockerin type I domain-containing protein [Pararhodobacter sp.]